MSTQRERHYQAHRVLEGLKSIVTPMTRVSLSIDYGLQSVTIQTYNAGAGVNIKRYQAETMEEAIENAVNNVNEDFDVRMAKYKGKTPEEEKVAREIWETIRSRME